MRCPHIPDMLIQSSLFFLLVRTFSLEVLIGCQLSSNFYVQRKNKAQPIFPLFKLIEHLMYIYYLYDEVFTINLERSQIEKRKDEGSLTTDDGVTKLSIPIIYWTMSFFVVIAVHCYGLLWSNNTTYSLRTFRAGLPFVLLGRA